MKPKKAVLLISLFFLFWLVCVLVCSSFGPASVSVADTFRIWSDKLSGTQSASLHSLSIIYWDIRLPRLLLASLAGAALAVSGAAFQGIFRNPMADPYVLGVSSGASLGAAVAIVLGWESWFFGISGTAFLFALGTVLIVYQIGSEGNRINTQILLLAGIALSFLLSALVSLLLVMKRDKIEKIVFWTLGGFNAASWNYVLGLLPVVVLGVGVVLYFSRSLNILMMGSESAPTLGVNTGFVVRVLLVVCSLMVSCVVSTSGVIGFAGLIVPHLVRLLTGPDNRLVVPFSMFSGAVFLVISDTLARNLISPGELPIGSITAFFGVPYFLFLLYKSRQQISI